MKGSGYPDCVCWNTLWHTPGGVIVVIVYRDESATATAPTAYGTTLKKRSCISDLLIVND